LAVIKPGIVYVFSFRRHKTFRSRANDFFLKTFQEKWRITFRLFATFGRRYEETRRVSCRPNVGEGGAGMSVATDLAD
jgi:hypothetical protein